MIDVETVSRNLMEPVVAIDADGIVAFANERFLEITQCDRVIGADHALLEQFVDGGFADFQAAVGAVAAADSDHERVELTMLHPEAAPVPRRLPAEVRLTPIVEDGSRIGILVVLRNIAERKRHEQRLTRQNERLAEFASVVSHDLRNPLNVAAGRLDLVMVECESEHLEEVAFAHDRMGELIENVLSLSRHGDPEPEVRSVDLAATIEDRWRSVRTAEATIAADTDAVVRAERSRLRQLLENLFRNAIEHGGSNVSISVGDLGDGFYVEDDGPGIPADGRDRVFEVGHSTATDGVGFGLSIVEEIADAHGWTVAVTGGNTGGARFEFTGVEIG